MDWLNDLHSITQMYAEKQKWEDKSETLLHEVKMRHLKLCQETWVKIFFAGLKFKRFV